MKKLKSTPLADGFHMPAEYELQEGCIMIWPWRPGTWSYEAKKARKVFAQTICQLARQEEVYLLIRPEDQENAFLTLSAENQSEEEDFRRIKDHIHLLEVENEDAWVRDTGPTFVIDAKGRRRGIDWLFNAWGGTYDGLYAHWEKDQKIPEAVCSYLGDELYDAQPFVLEGGSVHTDGEGTLITTEECLLSPGRNSHLTKKEIEEKLCGYLGISKVIWLPCGIYNDETNGHVDNICCFTAPGEVLLAWTDDPGDPQYIRSQAALHVLEQERDAKGRKIQVRKLPIPSRPITILEEDLKGLSFEEGEDQREVGERLAASYVNFYIANHCILLPQFDDPHDALAVSILKECFPEREIIKIAARSLLTGGGNIHCLTQQVPAANSKRQSIQREDHRHI